MPMLNLRTQGDALRAIRNALVTCKWDSMPTVYGIAEQGLSLPPAQLTPAQNNADALAGFLFDYADMLDGVPVDAQAKRAEMSELLDLLRPPKPPTLEEALAALRTIASGHGTVGNPIDAVAVARSIIARVPK
jgi:hypothetical protein